MFRIDPKSDWDSKRLLLECSDGKLICILSWSWTQRRNGYSTMETLPKATFRKIKCHKLFIPSKVFWGINYLQNPPSKTSCEIFCCGVFNVISSQLDQFWFSPWIIIAKIMWCYVAEKRIVSSKFERKEWMFLKIVSNRDGHVGWWNEQHIINAKINLINSVSKH